MYTPILTILSILASTTAMAQTTTTVPVTNSSAAPALGGQSTTSTSPSILNNVQVSLFSNLKGPNVNEIGTAETVNANGRTNKKQRIHFDSTVTAAYKIGATTGVGLVVPFLMMATKGQDFVLGDMGVSFFDRKAIQTKDFSLNANVAVQAPTSSASRERQMTLAVRTQPSMRYNIPESRFSLGAWTEAKAYLGANAGKLFKLWAAPYVSYQIAPKLSGILQYEYEASHFVNKAPLDFSLVQTDIVAGFAYMFSSSFMLNPYIAFYTTESLSMQNANIGAIITASI